MPIFYREALGDEGIVKWAKEWGARGLIGQLHHDSDLRKFLDAGIQVIALDFREKHTDVPNITGAYHETGRLGAEYFLKKGFKHFAFYGFNDIVWSRERAGGFEAKVREAGYTVDYFEHKKSRSMDLWYYKPSVLSKWLKGLPKPVALMACDDSQALHITEAAKHAGIQIPEEVAVLGVDNDETTCYLSDPPLSSISMDTEKAGYDTARLMEQLIRGRKAAVVDIIVKPTHVITRHSTDIFSANDKQVVRALKFIHTNISRNINVDHVLKEVALSRRSLEMRFVRITGYPVYKYIYRLRIEKFIRMLLETDKSVFEIALEMGLNDSKNITRQFRQVTGMTPLEYRKTHRLEPARPGTKRET